MIEEITMAIWTFYGLDGDPELPCYANCPSSTDLGSFLVNLVGVGNPCYVRSDFPLGLDPAGDLGANFNAGIVISSDYQTNRINAAAQIANPNPIGADNDGINVVWNL